MKITMFIVFGLALVGSIILTSLLIPVLQKKQMGQNIRQEGPVSHQSKAGTPSMGGVAIVIATVIAVFAGRKYNSDTFIILAGFIAFALLGFIDDYMKVIKKENEGLKVIPKFTAQFAISAMIAVYMVAISSHGSMVYIPFYGKSIDFGMFYIPFIIFTMLAMVNAVNLTDGLDGLAAGTTGIASLFMVYAAIFFSATQSQVFFLAVAGACIGFLAFNKNPAKVFMGDTGSLALGGGITVCAIVMKGELLLPIVGIIYVLEALSVCMQVVYFKATGGKRIFRMTPLHHHFELGGMKETKVVSMFWAATVLASMLGVLALR